MFMFTFANLAMRVARIFNIILKIFGRKRILKYEKFFYIIIYKITWKYTEFKRNCIY